MTITNPLYALKPDFSRSYPNDLGQIWPISPFQILIRLFRMAIEAYKYFLSVTNERPNNTESPSAQTQKLAQIGQKRKMMTPKPPTQKIAKMAQPPTPSSPQTEIFQRILQNPPSTSETAPASSAYVQSETISFESSAQDKKSQILENLAAESDPEDNVMVIQPDNDTRVEEPEDENEEDIEEVIQFDSSMGVKSEVDRTGQGTHTLRKILPKNLTLNDLIMTSTPDQEKGQGNTDGSSIPLNGLDGLDTPDTFNEVEQIINPIDPAIIAQRLRVSRWDWKMRRRVLRNGYVT